MDYYTQLLTIIKDFSVLGYLIIFFMAFFESLAFIGLVIPGSVAVVVGGFLAAQGVLDVGDLFMFSVLGAILGDSISYYLGGKGIIKFDERNKIFKPSLLLKGENYFKKHGGKSVFWGRFIGWVRPIIPFVAGIFNIDRKTFYMWNILSAVLWAVAHIALGFFFGQAWGTIVVWLTRGSILAIVITILVIVFYILKLFVIRKGAFFSSILVTIWRSIKLGVVNNKDVQRLVKRHPLFFYFLKRRFDKNRFFGLPVTLLFLAVLYTVFLFAGIVEDVITANVITSLDIRFSNLFAMFRDGDMTRFFLFITMLGKWYTVLIFITATMGTLFVWGKKIYIIPLLLAVIGSEAFTFLGKIIIHRARPEMAMYIEHSFSFPSGHATIALAFYGFLVYMIFRSASTRKMKINTIFIGGTIIFLIGFSRLYLGVHYVSDVVGGYLVGAIWLMIGISVSEWIRSMKFEEKLNYSRYKAKTYTIILILLSFIFYLLVAAQYSPNILSNAIIQKSLNGDKVDDVFYKETDKFTKTLFGNTQEPISFMLYAKNDIELKKIFNNAGWYLSDEASLSSMFEISKAVLINGQYLRAPMTPSFWNKLPNGFGFEKPDKSNGVRQRHHVRFWKTDYVTTTGKRVYVGTASFDSGIKWGITHRINPSIDSEREFLFQDLKSTGKIMKYKKQKLVEPTLGQNFSGDQFFTDGKMYIVDFK